MGLLSLSHTHIDVHTANKTLIINTYLHSHMYR